MAESNIELTWEAYQETLLEHINFSIEHGGFIAGKHAHGGCSCPICTMLRNYFKSLYDNHVQKMAGTA